MTERKTNIAFEKSEHVILYLDRKKSRKSVTEF